MKPVTKSVGASVVRVAKFLSWRLDIMLPAEVTEDMENYLPPTSITLYTENNIRALRDILTEALED
jgi:hypothetical protein